MISDKFNIIFLQECAILTSFRVDYRRTQNYKSSFQITKVFHAGLLKKVSTKLPVELTLECSLDKRCRVKYYQEHHMLQMTWNLGTKILN